MKQIPLDELHVEYLRERHDLSFFRCSNDDLNDFLKGDAKQSQEDLISRTYPRYPAIKIARLAVDEKFEGGGIGRFLLLWATGKVYQLSREVGCRYITLDSKRESVGFYEKFGFKVIKKYASRSFPPMYLNMYPIVLQMQQENSEKG
jgi:GNAT superfamily N-acetyltransferase